MEDLDRPDHHFSGGGIDPESMKPISHLQLALLLMGLMSARALEAADVVVDRHEVASAISETASSGEISEVRIPSNLDLPDSVKGLAADFRTQAQNYVNRQKELWKRAEGATKVEREKLKEQLKVNRAEFLQQTRQLRAELKERIKELQKSIGSSRPLDDGVAERGGRTRRGR